MDVLSAFALGTASSITGSFIFLKSRTLISNRYLRKILNFGKDDLLFVFGHREKGIKSILPRLATEDFIAMNNVTTALAKAGWNHPIKVRDTKHLQEDDKKRNIVTLGGPKVNSFTNEILNELAARKIKIFRFEKENGYDDRYKICCNDAINYCSKSFEQEFNSSAKENLMEGELNDVAFIAKITNPWNSSNKILIINGVRGIGTWGAAEYLRKSPNQIYHKKMGSSGKDKGGDFAVAVTIKYKNCDIKEIEYQQFIDIS
ncbi:hypothetical protein KA005_65845 [bacterium]|nr:hypothetical protein [bacterium]